MVSLRNALVDAFKAGKAPSVVLEATHIHALEFIALEDLRFPRREVNRPICHHRDGVTDRSAHGWLAAGAFLCAVVRWLFCIRVADASLVTATGSA